MKPINYIKPPNCTKFFEKLEGFNFTNPQNYNPVYERFFTLSSLNFNKIHLNHKYHIADITQTEISTNKHYIFNSVLQDCSNNNTNNNNNNNNANNNNKSKKPYTFKQNIFIKVSPLIDPFNYITGNFPDEILDDLTGCLPIPSCNNPNNESLKNKEMEKIYDVNNASYVDGFFSFLSNQLVEGFGFKNGIRYYGSFLTIKKQFMFNIADDLDYLVQSVFFNTRQNVLFQVDDYSHIIRPTTPKLRLNFENLEPLGAEFILSMQEEHVQEEHCDDTKSIECIALTTDTTTVVQETELTKEIQNTNTIVKLKNSSLSSSSSWSSRSSQSGKEEEEEEEEEEDEESENEDSEGNSSTSSSSYEEEQIYATISKYPVQLICLEKCVGTLDEFMNSQKINDNEWFAILMQIIMTLVVYQKAFHFTHNDLHTNNIMYVKTEQKFIYYRHDGKLYKVPTYGKIYKIIDFGRAIFDYRGHRFCSNSFEKNGDAHSQYNTEPYFDTTKPKIEPNYSFDLCRLACALFDDLLDVDFDGEGSFKQLIAKNTNPVAKLMAEWCTSDDGKNILYKDNGDERYLDFKLYKMIARKVHKHVPSEQLSRPEFKQFLCAPNRLLPKDAGCLNIDEIKTYV